jgi:hypothetical protein
MYGAAVRPCRRLALALLVLTGAACSPKKPPPDHTDLHPEDTATTIEAPTTAPPTTPALGEQVKTVEAAQRLLDLLAHLDGEAARMLLAKGAPDAEFDQALQTIHVGQDLETARQVFDREAKLGLAGYARPQPDPIYRAKRIVDARRDDCVVVAGTLDLRPRYATPVEVIEGIFLLVVQEGVAPSGGNPTRWRILAAGHPEPGQDVGAICDRL